MLQNSENAKKFLKATASFQQFSFYRWALLIPETPCFSGSEMFLLNSTNSSLLTTFILLLNTAKVHTNLNASYIGMQQPLSMVNYTSLVKQEDYGNSNSSLHVTSDYEYEEPVTKQTLTAPEELSSNTPLAFTEDQDFDIGVILNQSTTYSINSTEFMVTSTATLPLSDQVNSFIPDYGPTGFELPLNLLTDADWQPGSAAVLAIPHIYRGCKRFERGVTEECKYYGDCCQDPMRVWEQLDRDTFSCQKLSNVSPKGESNLHFAIEL